ncbi:MAG TPA: pitrilysin family protein [Dehalococcoidia bacterium]|jgi:predicted Zn-dependent peptidase|nr:pitrilysin family protein [Dehalococcoidia bacterium]
MSPAFSETVYTKKRFANGLRLLTSPMPHTRSVAISIYVGAGSRYETPTEAGVSHFLEHLCFKGTAKRPEAQIISEAIDGVGGIINAATDREYTVFYAKVAAPHTELALDVLCDLVQAPLLDAGELEKERKVVLEELASVADSPAQQVDLLLDELLWPDQPLGWDVAGTNESVKGLTRDLVADYVRRQYVPNNMVVAVAGNIDEENIAGLLETRLGAMAKGKPDPWFPAKDGQSEPRCRLIFKRTEQTHVAIGMHALPLGHPDRHALDLISVLFGESMSSRLFVELRERQGLCYDVNSYVTHFKDAGSFGVYAAVDPANGPKAVGALMGELRRLADGIPEEELHKARELAKGRLLLRLEDTRAVSGWLGGQEMLMGEILSPEDVVERLDRVTPDDMTRVSRGLLRTDKLNLAVVGPHRSETRFRPLLTL